VAGDEGNNNFPRDARASDPNGSGSMISCRWVWIIFPITDPSSSDVSLFIEERIKMSERMSILLRLEGFNIFNHGNYLGRGQTTYGDTGTPLPTFGQLAPAGAATNAIPAFANIDPPRMFQVQARFIF
jgi:hypothetical protein